MTFVGKGIRPVNGSAWDNPPKARVLTWAEVAERFGFKPWRTVVRNPGSAFVRVPGCLRPLQPVSERFTSADQLRRLTEDTATHVIFACEVTEFTFQVPLGPNKSLIDGPVRYSVMLVRVPKENAHG